MFVLQTNLMMLSNGSFVEYDPEVYMEVVEQTMYDK